MESKITITTEMIQNASDYMPLMQKHRLVEEIAPKCIAKVKMSYIPTAGGDEEPMPDRYQEVPPLTNMFLMGVLAKEYLHLPFDGDDSLQMPANVYDMFAGSHVMGQLEKLKSDKDVGRKASNLLYDFKEFRWTLGQEIQTLIGHNNDVVWRLMDAMSESIKGVLLDAAKAAEPEPQPELTPEQMQEAALKAKAQLEEGIEKLKAMKDGLARMKEEAEAKGAAAYA